VTGPGSPAPLDGYDQLLGDVRQILAAARDRAYQAIDNLRVQAYWQVGERIVREELRQGGRADYGERIVARLAADLGFGRSDMYRIVRFYRAYPVMTALDQRLSWTHYTVLIDVTDTAARRFYEGWSIRETWSVRELRAQIRDDRYSRSLEAPDGAAVPARVVPASRPTEVFRALYDVALPGLPTDFSEAQLERALRADFERFLSELGPDFYLRGTQQQLVIDGSYHAVDLELYHRGIPCIVLYVTWNNVSSFASLGPAHCGTRRCHDRGEVRALSDLGAIGVGQNMADHPSETRSRGEYHRRVWPGARGVSPLQPSAWRGGRVRGTGAHRQLCA